MNIIRNTIESAEHILLCAKLSLNHWSSMI